MILEKLKPCGVVIEEIKIEEYAQFLNKTLEFTVLDRKNESILLSQNGFYILVKKSDSKNLPVSVDGFCGIEHFALGTANAAKAIGYPGFSSVSLNTDLGVPYDNPGVWNLGTKYFDFIFQDDLKIEICERLDPAEPDKVPFKGLSHIGMPVSNHNQAIDFYKQLGFKVDCTVNVESETEGSYVCSMMVKNDFWLEIYEMTDAKNKVFGHGAIKGVICLVEEGDFTEVISRLSELTKVSSEEGKIVAEATDGINLYLVNNI